MSYTYQGDAILGISLTVDTPQPLDTRTVVNNTKDLYNVPTSQAYQGMTVANLEDGNIYMLIDKNKINTSDGWKSSESALQIVTCSQEDYNKWAENTTDKYQPIDPNKPYIIQSVYYYIYEDQELGQYYLSSEWGKSIEDLLGKKASSDSVNTLIGRVNADIENLANNYTTTETLIETYATKALIESMFNMEDSESFISKTLDNYYTKANVDDKFVTKASLGGNLEGLEGENFVFVTSKQYQEDQAAIQEELDRTLKLDGEGSLNSITVGQIKSPQVEGKQLIVDVRAEGLFVGNDPIAKESDIPVIITLSAKEYQDKVDKKEINPEAYYCIFDEENNKLVYVTLQELENSYSTTAQTQHWVAQNYYTMSKINELIDSLSTSKDENLEVNLLSYYTKEDADAKFLTQTSAEDTYVVKQTLEDFKTEVGTDYVKWDDIGNPNIEGENFAFVTQEQYANDKAAQSENFESENITSDISTTSELIIQEIEKKEVEQGDVIQIEKKVLSEVALTVKNNRLLSEDKQVALTEEVPQLECLTVDAYNAIEKPDPNVYYCVYDTKEENAWVTQAYVDEFIYTKAQANQYIANSISEAKKEFNAKIEALESEIALLKSMLLTSVSNKKLTLGLADNISDNTLIANTGTIEGHTLIFT